MKNLKHYALLLLCVLATLGTASCSDDNNDDPTPTPTNQRQDGQMGAIVKQYVKDVVLPTYADLASASIELRDACAQLYQKRSAGQLTQADIDAACDAFKKARRQWEQSEAFLYGAATDNDIDPHIDSWPLDQAQLADALTSSTVIAGITGSNPGQFVYTSNTNFDSTMGFHGLEFVLFRSGKNRTLAAFTAEHEDGADITNTQNRAKLQTVTTLQEAAFAAAVSQDLANMTCLLEYGWAGDAIAQSHKAVLDAAPWTTGALRYKGLSSAGIAYGAWYTSNDKDKCAFQTWHETLQNVFVGGCSNICQEVFTQKLGQAYRVATGQAEEEDAGDYIESPYSKRSFQDYQDNIYSIKNSLYGLRGTESVSQPAATSILAFLRDNGYEGYNDLRTAIDQAVSALETAKNSGRAFIDAPGDAQVGKCIDAVSKLDSELQKAGTWINRVSDK